MIEIEFASYHGRRRPRLSIEKRHPVPEIVRFEVNISLSPERKIAIKPEFFTDDYEQIRRTIRPRTRGDSFSEVENARELIQQIIQVSWLPVGRLETAERTYNRDRAINTVDLKIEHNERSLLEYFQSLSTKQAELTSQFQYSIFSDFFDENSYSAEVPGNKATDQNTRLLKSIFTHFGMKEEEARERASSYIKEYNSIVTSFGHRALDLPQLRRLLDGSRVLSIAERWRFTEERINELYSPRDAFLQLINDLYQRKILSFTNRGLPQIRTSTSKTLKVTDLSSGEKQLFILLSDFLIQEQKRITHISDEPELSLHVEWQSRLFEALIRLNRNAQMITATHSPDIVGPFHEKLMRMEDCIHDI